MKLTQKQKKYIKKHIKKNSIAEISDSLHIDPERVKSYLIKIRGKQYVTSLIKQKPIRKKTNKVYLFDTRQFFNNHRYFILLLILLVLITYANSLNNKFVSDDIAGILHNKNIGKFHFSIFHPTSLIGSFQFNLRAITYRLFGMSPIAFRSVNIIFHMASVIATYVLVYLLLGNTIAFLSASIMAVHPIMTESVTWISGGGYCSYSFFSIITIIFYILARQKKSLYALSLLSFIFALTISEKAVVIPIIIILLDWSYNTKLPNWKVVTSLTIPAALVAAFFILKLPERQAWLRTSYSQFHPHIALSFPQQVISFVHLVAVATTSYLSLIFWPDKLTLYHSEMFFSRTQIIIQVVILLALLAAIIWGLFKNKKIAFWLSWFFIALSPTMTPFGVSWIVAERYVYLASVGIFVLIAMAIVQIGRLVHNPQATYAILILLLVPLSIRTIIRNNDWKDQDHLWLAAARTSPSSSQNHNNLGDMYGRHGDLNRAIQEFKTAIKLNPHYADAYHNLANVYIGKKEFGKAIKNYKLAIKYNPHLWQSYQSLAIIYFRQKKFALAEQHFKKAIAINPKNDNLHVNLGIFYLNLKEKEKAKQEFQAAIKINPHNKRAQQLLLSLL